MNIRKNINNILKLQQNNTIESFQCFLLKYISILFYVLILSFSSALNAADTKTTAPTRKAQFITYIKAEEKGAPAGFDSPRAFYVDKEAQVLYVLASPSGPVYKFDLQGDYKFVQEIGKDAGFSNDLMDLKISPNGELFVVDAKKNVLFVFDIQGSLKQIINAKDNRKNKSGLGIIFIDFNRRGDIFLSDKGGHGIQVLDLEGNYLYEIVKAKSDKGEFGFPSISQLRLNSSDEVYVLDNMMCKIIKFNAKGKTLTVFGGRGDVAGKFVDATSMAIDQKDRIYIMEQLTGTVQVFDKDGNFLHVMVDEKGDRLILSSPTRVDVDKSNRLFFIERRENRIVVLKFVD